MLEFGNIYYYLLFIVAMLFFTILSVALLKNKSDKFITIYIFSILFSGFILHFLKFFFEPYRSNLPNAYVHLSFESISASCTILFPWFYISKSKSLKDFLVVIGFFSGLSSVILPYQSVGFTKITFEIVRFYYAHYIFFLASFLMLYTRQYQFNIKSIFKVPFLLYGILILILANEVVLIAIGLSDLNLLLSPQYRNIALIYGPNKHFINYKWLYEPFVPKVFTKIPFGPLAGTVMYWPVIWLVIPAYFYIFIAGVIIDILFNHLRNYLSKLSEKRESELFSSNITLIS